MKRQQAAKHDRGHRSRKNAAGVQENGTLSIGELAREYGVTLRALRFYQSKGLLTPQRNGRTRQFTLEDRQRLGLIIEAKRLRFTLTEVRQMLKAWRPGSGYLPISREQCIEQIRLLERETRELHGALHELRRIYTGLSNFGPKEHVDSAKSPAQRA